jgi:hypothetical protein
MIPALAIGIALAIVLAVLWSRYVRLKRERYIRDYTLPKGLYERLRKRRPELEMKDCMLVARGLRKFFLAHLNSGRKFVSMPSQVVDDLWHEFILYTKAYDDFCKHAFGRFLHHTPAVVLGPEKRDNEGLRRVWWYACKEENIDPPSRCACRCCLPSTPSSASPTASPMHRTASRCNATDRETSTAARISATVPSTAAPMVSVTVMAEGMVAAMGAVVAGAAATDRRYHFFAAISFITSISRSRSATSFFSRLFSVSNTLRRFTSLLTISPYRLRHA